jgi:Ca-activated chloride channel family protein
VLLIGLSAACLVVALMRPQLGVRHVAAQRVGAQIMLALDVSKSMLAEDVAPNRLERAKAEIVDLLGYLDGDQVGLIAFAGRATVLAPMTPDFSFLRLVLDGAGAHSVPRGGTRLEEPIRKALQGFGPAGEASRAILLITDGEDHDSFPLDAADEAAEAGIVIVAIGFGDENGSEIIVTDPRSGARELLRDADGRPVRSRLDGELLRDLALRTGGAYVPAGTGVLDLESIYRQHIERLTVGQLDPRGRTVRDEGYQWAVLLALVLLVSAVAIAGRGAGVRAASVALVFAVFASPAARAEPAEGAAGGEVAAVAPESEPAPAEAPLAHSAPAEPPEPESPREIFNRGVAALDAGDRDGAARWFDRARRDAGADGELRFRAAYDLGIAHARRAETLESESPEEALRVLYTAADWFRDAIAQREDDEDARVNLDVALRRALLLADRIARADAKGVDAELEEIADRQRALVGELAGLLALVSEDPEVFTADRLRREFRARATGQRTLLADADRLARQIDDERQAIEARPEAERTPEDRMRGAQLEGVLHYFHRAREHMGQARRQLRQRQAERAFRRGSGALSELKRALDQLRDPVALLDVLIREATQVATQTAALAAARRELPGGMEPPPIPPWLSDASLRDDQQNVADRTDELDRRLLAGLQQDPPADPQQQALLDAVGEAEPLVASASASFASAAEALESGAPEAALSDQREGVVALTDARERFLDLRGLIEATYADERRIEAVLSAEGDAAAATRQEYLPALRELQARNVARAERLAGKLEAAAQAPPPSPDGGAADPEAAAIQQKRLLLAGQLLTLALGRMDDVSLALLGEGAWPAALAGGRAAVEHLEALRRLFFSIVEQLRETAREQLDLADATREAAALSDRASDDALARLGPLAPRQEELSERAGDIASALEEQSHQTGGVLEEDADGFETSRRLRLAAEHTLLAQTEMEGAAEDLAAAPPELDRTHERQTTAIAELEEALALLVPPEERERGEDSEQPGEEPGGEQQEQQPSEEQAGPAADPAQLLQAVRDREAQRRRDREQRGAAGYETVEKDW